MWEGLQSLSIKAIINYKFQDNTVVAMVKDCSSSAHGDTGYVLANNHPLKNRSGQFMISVGIFS